MSAGSGARTVWIVLPYHDTGGQTRTMRSLARGLSERGLHTEFLVAQAGDPGFDESAFLGRIGLEDAVISATDQPLTRLLAGARSNGLIGWWAVAVHSWGPLGELSTITSVEAVAIAAADAVIALCACHRANLLLQLPDVAERIYVIHNGIEIPSSCRHSKQGSRFRRRHGIAQSDCVLAMLGQFDGRKRQDLALATFTMLRRNTEIPLRLLLAGDGPQFPAIEDAVGSAGLSDVVTLPGHVADSRILWAASDIALLLSDHEVLPLALLEAASAGLPLVANDVGCIAEVVVDGLSGRLCASLDPREVEPAVRGLVCSPNARSAMGGAGRELVSRCFSRAAMLDAWVDLLRCGGHAIESKD